MAASTYTGIAAPLLIGKITRLAGGDFQINGHPYGKFPVPYKMFYRSFKFFTQPWWNIKPMMYACSGGTTQLAVEKIIRDVGTDVILAAGGGVHGHPDGSEAGAKSMRQAIDAAIAGIPVTEYAKDLSLIHISYPAPIIPRRPYEPAQISYCYSLIIAESFFRCNRSRRPGRLSIQAVLLSISHNFFR